MEGNHVKNHIKQLDTDKNMQMEYYIIKNKRMPWGDYGNTLFSGLLKILDKDYEELDFPELQRTGPYIPEIFIANSRNLILKDDIKKGIEKAEILGIKKFKKVLKKKIVDIDWHTWDLDAKEPKYYPESGEPENYILKKKNDFSLINSTPELWELDMIQEHTICKVSQQIDNIGYTDIALMESPKYDIFSPRNMNFIIISEKLKQLFEDSQVTTLQYIKIKIIYK